jgi:hypothetical protein
MCLRDEVRACARLPLKVVVSWSPQDRRCRSLRPCAVLCVETPRRFVSSARLLKPALTRLITPLSPGCRKRGREAIDNGGVFHLWGHSWELDDADQWRRLGRVLQAMKEITANAPSLENGQIAQHFLTSAQSDDVATGDGVCVR